MQQIEHMEQIELIKPSQLMELIKQVELDKVWANKANGESKTEYTIYIQLLKHKEQVNVLELIEHVQLTPQIE